ncbi:MAG: TolC family protein, partial [Sterolibacterium sp.]
MSENQVTINQFYLTSQVGLQVNIPLYAGGYTSSQIRQALANLEKFQQQYEARRREVDLQIRKEFQNVAEGVLKVKAQEQAERSADQALFSNQKGYQAGTRTQIDILNAQQQRMNVRRDLANARYQYLMARIRLQGLVASL